VNDKRTYNSWSAMKARCLSPSNGNFAKYGGRGITFCVRWLSFDNFLADMGERPEGKTLDRIDSAGNYEPSNCRWATQAEQTANRRRSAQPKHFLTWRGETRTIDAWAAITGMSASTIHGRVIGGWDHAQILETAPRTRAA
jgi:hypothetical protein